MILFLFFVGMIVWIVVSSKRKKEQNDYANHLLDIQIQLQKKHENK